ncbi:antibiotic biosynthesis monooxygenase [Streptomyces sp. NPDC047097]|uniref:antibiotic biosynthesis monooxygenase n=1 Tax=Streptomyces sp. NPDC047097 TaxID=3155260 RepID=UPI0033CBD124
MSAGSVVSEPYARPRLDRPGVGVVKVSTWRVGTPERQRAVAEAIGRAWRSRPWPAPGPLSYTVLVGEDGESLLHYGQWASEEDYQGFVRRGRDERVAEVDAAVPGIERTEPTSYEVYRSVGMGGEGTAPGCVVAVEVEFDGPDGERVRRWVDGVLDALAADADSGAGPHPGGISATFHTSLDGTRMLNYAEWESARHHADALDGPRGVGNDSPQWQRVRTFPGMADSHFRRFSPALSLRAGE